MEQYKVLIVEDDPMVAMINEEYVSKNKNFTVVNSCRNGQDAIEYLKENKVDLIVLDVYMPIMDGIETLKRIRELKISSEVIMVTAANDSTTLKETMNLGVVDYLIKPFAMDRFLIALEKFSEKVSALNNSTILDQNCIDSIISGKQKDFPKVIKNLPKGIQENTLNLIQNYFNDHNGWLSGDSVAEDLGISVVTARHYLSYLAQNHIISESTNYSTGGRPRMVYKKN